MEEVLAYVKNQSLGFSIPFTLAGEERRYLPDYLVRLDDGRGPGDPLNLVLEVTGQKDDAKTAKVETARDLWVPAVNQEGSFGRWAFYELRDPWNAKRELRSFLTGGEQHAA